MKSKRKYTKRNKKTKKNMKGGAGRGYRTGTLHHPLPPANTPFTLYIPYMHHQITKKMISDVLRKTSIGKVSEQDAIELIKHERKGSIPPYQSAKIHFDFPFNMQLLNHLRYGPPDAHFQVVYHATHRNPKTGKDEPDRFFVVKLWREGEKITPPEFSENESEYLSQELELSKPKPVEGASVGKSAAAEPKNSNLDDIISKLDIIINILQKQK